MLLVLAASKGTSWAVASCSHETTPWTEKVSLRFTLPPTGALRFNIRVDHSIKMCCSAALIFRRYVM